MKSKQIIKIIVDIMMTLGLLFLMAYSLIGEAVHEWLGAGMFVLFILHHILNGRWSRSLFKGKYALYRIVQTALVVFVLLSMTGSMISGVVLSRYVFSFLPFKGGSSWARTLHMLSAYWGFVFLSLHLGLHWNVMMGMTKRMYKKPSVVRAWIMRAAGFAVAGYGAYAFIRREIGSYMFLKIQFVFFDFEEPLLFFLIDYMAAMGLFVFIGHYLSESLRAKGRRRAAAGNNSDNL